MQNKTPAQQVRPILIKLFGRKNIKCVNGTGTAYGWVTANVLIDSPKNCNCETHIKQLDLDRCVICQDKRNEIRNKIEKAVNHVEFYHYYADDGYNTKRREFLLDIKFK